MVNEVSEASAELSIGIVGGGPRGLGVLDSLGANTAEYLSPGQRLVVHIFEPYPVGAGRVWRREQSPLMWMNLPTAATTMFPDETSTMVGPNRRGPSLYEWIVAHREGLLQDELLADEARRTTPDTFATRSMQSAYMKWAFQHLVEVRTPGIEVVVHADSVVDIRDGELQTVVTAGGEEVEVQQVVLALGHHDLELSDAQRDILGFAKEHDLVYLPAGYTADLDPDAVPEGEAVIVVGMGLAFIDWMALLTEGRGGKFVTQSNGELEYLPSGHEPIMYAGSRRGAACHPKITSPLRAGTPELPRFFSVDGVIERFPRLAEADFFSDLWPIACKELAGAHYAELLQANPDRVNGSWEAFLAEFSQLDYGSPEMESLVARYVPNEADRFDIEKIRTPFTDRGQSAHEVDAEVLADVEFRLRRITDPLASVDTAVVRAFFSIYDVFGQLSRRGLISPAAVTRGVDGWLHGLFAHVTSGPPPERLAQLVALHRAGLVRFLGDGIAVELGSEGIFLARSRAVAEPVAARALIEARLPVADIRRSTDRLSRALVERGEATDRLAEMHSGRMRVDAFGRVLNTAGTPHTARWAVGPWVSDTGWANAFPTPGIDAGFFRQNATLAQTMLEALVAIDASEPVSLETAPLGEQIGQR